MKKADLDNPRRLTQACRLFIKGLLGHYFSRPLTADEGELLRTIVNVHGTCIFMNENHQPIGAWLCTCVDCELLIAALAGEAKISIIAHQTGESNFILKDENTLEIYAQELGSADRARAQLVISTAANVAAEVGTKAAELRVSSIASEVAAQVAFQVASQVAARLLLPHPANENSLKERKNNG